MNDFSSVRNRIEALYADCLPMRSGAIEPTLEPYLNADEETFAVSVTTVGGDRFSCGLSDSVFPILSVSKPFVYGLALDKVGADVVLETMNVEPTGSEFNQILQSDEIRNRIYNPLINAGALMVTSMIPGGSLGRRARSLMNWFETIAGAPIEVNEAYLNHKRKQDSMMHAIAYALQHENLLHGEVKDATDLYAQQCAIELNTRTLSVMAATLANGGTNPLTGKRAFSPEIARQILSVLYVCGLYTFSGEWCYRVGLPAKSGLAGIIMVVVPNRMGMVTYSPLLGDHDKSLRGLQFFTRWQQHQNDHLFTSTTSVLMEEVRPGRKRRAPSRRSYHKWVGDMLMKSFDSQRENFKGLIYQSETNLHANRPDDFSACLCWLDGTRTRYGSYQSPFLLQSISKVFTYGMALEDNGREYVLSRVGVEPTGYSYNSAIRVQQKNKRPYNPMVNTGAIAVTSLLKGNTPAQRLRRVLDMYSGFIGKKVHVDMPTYISEQTRGDRNWAIAYLLRSLGMIDAHIEQTLDLYLQQCSVLVTCDELATMAATLANGGMNPMTGQQAIRTEYVQDILSVMSSCGMYDYSGRWMYRIGFPAKSGVGGGMIVVVPGRFGLAVYSPLIDSRGNSIRGIELCKTFFESLDLHSLRVAPVQSQST